MNESQYFPKQQAYLLPAPYLSLTHSLHQVIVIECLQFTSHCKMWSTQRYLRSRPCSPEAYSLWETIHDLIHARNSHLAPTCSRHLGTGTMCRPTVPPQAVSWILNPLPGLLILSITPLLPEFSSFCSLLISKSNSPYKVATLRQVMRDFMGVWVKAVHLEGTWVQVMTRPLLGCVTLDTNSQVLLLSTNLTGLWISCLRSSDMSSRMANPKSSRAG
jgi:hypothetical protein